MTGGLEKLPCVCGRECDAANRALHRMITESPVLSAMFSGPRYRYYEVKTARSHYTFEWTTERANEDKFWAVKRKWVKGQGRIVQRMGFSQRNKAKARAYAWYEKARGQ